MKRPYIKTDHIKSASTKPATTQDDEEHSLGLRALSLEKACSQPAVVHRRTFLTKTLTSSTIARRDLGSIKSNTRILSTTKSRTRTGMIQRVLSTSAYRVTRRKCLPVSTVCAHVSGVLFGRRKNIARLQRGPPSKRRFQEFQAAELAANDASVQFRSRDGPYDTYRKRGTHKTHHACTKSGEGILPTHGLGRNLAASCRFGSLVWCWPAAATVYGIDRNPSNRAAWNLYLHPMSCSVGQPVVGLGAS